MDAPVGLGDGNALHAMCAALIFHTAVRAASLHDEGYVFDAALPSFVAVQDFDFPALTIGIAGVHAKKFAREKCGLVSASAALDGDNGVFLVQDVFWQQRNFNLFEQLLFALLEAFYLFIGHIAHFWLIAGVIHLLRVGNLP